MTKWGFLFVFFLGFLGYAGMNLFFKETNTLEFCTSCHTMQQNLKEYQETAHYKNHAGVRAICSDCHVPKAPLAKIWTKLYAAKDVYHEIIGTIDTPEKFEAHRWEMANRVWDKMRESDSRECRSCHSWEAMMFKDQDKSASKRHQRAKQEGKTCIDCHKGVVHEEPNEPEDATESSSENKLTDSSKTVDMATTAVLKETVAKKVEKPEQQKKNENDNKNDQKASAPQIPKAPAKPLAPAMASTDADDAGPLTKLVNSCNKCHGKDGNSKQKEVPNIAKASAIYLHDTLVAFKSGDRKGEEYRDADGNVTDMNKVTADLNEEQITALSEYYAAKSFVPHSQNANLAMADEGAKLFNKKCDKCHSDGGTNPEDDAGILAGQPRQYLINQFSYFDKGEREMPRKMRKKFKKLTDEQKQQIIEFLIK